MVCEWGMSEKMGPMTYRRKEEEVFLGRDIGRDQAVFRPDGASHRLRSQTHDFGQAITNAHKLIQDNRAKLDRLVDKLMEKKRWTVKRSSLLIGEGGGLPSSA